MSVLNWIYLLNLLLAPFLLLSFIYGLFLFEVNDIPNTTHLHFCYSPLNSLF